MTIGENDRVRRSLEPSVVRAYLIRAGWRSANQDAPISLWNAPNPDSGVKVALPARGDLVDYPQLLDEGIRAIAYLEQRTRDEVRSDIELGGADSVSVRLTPDMPPGQAPLGLAESAIASLKELVVGSAAAASNPEWRIGSRRPKRAKRYADGVRLSTSPGSFVVTLTMPIAERAAGDTDDRAQTDLHFEPEPFGRVVVTRMSRVASGSAALARDVAAGLQPLAAFEENPAATGNAIELGALANIGGDFHRAYQVRFAVSPVLRTDEEPPQVITITGSEQNVLFDASALLRSMHPREAQQVEGLVVRLAREQGWGPGEVAIQGRASGSQIEHRYRVVLPEDAYLQALTAHQRGLRVSLVGDVDLRGTHLHLEAPRDFVVVADLGHG